MLNCHGIEDGRAQPFVILMYKYTNVKHPRKLDRGTHPECWEVARVGEWLERAIRLTRTMEAPGAPMPHGP